MPPVNSGHLVHAVREQLRHAIGNLGPESRRTRRDLDIKWQTVDLCERVLAGTDDGTRLLAIAILTNLHETFET